MERPGYAERWNRAYDEAPPHLRFQIIVWGLVAIGAINMLLTVWFGFPFALLLVLAIAWLAWIRVWPQIAAHRPVSESRDAYGTGSASDGTSMTFTPSQVPLANSFPGFNTWMDRLTELERVGVHLTVLGLAGLINMLLTIQGGFPFGLLFLFAFVALAVMRLPWVFARNRAQYEAYRASRRQVGLLPRTVEGGSPDAVDRPNGASPSSGSGPGPGPSSSTG
jgi:type III secretory pathway component EscV